MSDILEELAGPDPEPDGAPAKPKDAYDLLPESIKATYARHQWIWFSDSEKANLVSTECEPEAYEDS